MVTVIRQRLRMKVTQWLIIAQRNLQLVLKTKDVCPFDLEHLERNISYLRILAVYQYLSF